MREFFEQSVTERPRIDRAAGLLRRVHILGPISKHGYRYDLDGMRKAAPKLDGLCVGLDHDYESKPMKIADTWGTLKGPIEIDSEGAWGNLAYLKSHARTEQILEDCEHGTRIFGLSLVNRDAVEKGGVVVSFNPIRCDVVVGAATTKSLMEQARPGLHHEFDLRTFWEQAGQEQPSFDVREWWEQATVNRQADGVDAATFWEQATQEPSDFDLRTFWDKAVASR